LRLAQDGREGVAAWIAGPFTRVAPHLHRLREPRDAHLDFAPVLSGTDAHLADLGRLEPLRFDANRIAARLERPEHGITAAAGVEHQRCPSRRVLTNGHMRTDDHSSARIHDGDPNRGIGA
jgi:hypothetical protein